MPVRKTYKRKYVPKKRVYKPKKTISKKKSNFARAVMSVVNKKAEVKLQPLVVADYDEVKHNIIQNLTDNAFFTKLGTPGEGNVATTSGSRIGKVIFAKGMKVALNIQQSQKRALCKYVLYLVRNKVVPDSTIDDKAEMFEGYTNTIPMDYIDTDKVQILFAKYITIKMPNLATAKDMVNPSGLANLAEPDNLYKGVVTNPQHFSKFYIPLNRKIMYRDYEDGGTWSNNPIGNNRYQWVITAYDNHDTDRGGTPGTEVLAHIKMTTQLLFTDV
jgi:hypothetical protein